MVGPNLENWGLKLPFTLGHTPDNEKIWRKEACHPIDYPKPDGRLSFDRLTNVAFSFTNHEESQPCHLKLKDPTIPIRFSDNVSETSRRTTRSP